MVESDTFESYVQEGFLLIPEKFRNQIKNVALLVEDEPSLEIRIREGLGPHQTLLGYYHGIPHPARGDYYGVGPTLPDTITLFKNPIIEAAEGDPVQVKQIIADTIWHEFAHYFGMDEETVRDREKKKGIHRH